MCWAGKSCINAELLSYILICTETVREVEEFTSGEVLGVLGGLVFFVIGLREAYNFLDT